MKITVHGITIEGTPDELSGPLQMLLEHAVAQSAEIDGAGDGHTTSDGESSKTAKTPMTAQDVAQLWPSLTSNAQAALAEIAKRPEGYPSDQLLSVLKVDGPALGGYLSSLGFGMRRFPHRQYPLIRDLQSSEYKLAPDIAEAIRQQAPK